jgi:hypothetical protein
MGMRTVTTLVMVLALVGSASGLELETPFERDPERTPRFDETVAWFADLAGRSDRIALSSFGTSAQGRDLPLVIWDPAGLRDPGACRQAGRLVLLVQACIHAGESCGKDAAMGWLRDLARDGGPDGVTVVLMPIFNADGHERFGPYNRINQNGPREMGWRVTAQNLNLNRDYYKADTPEMQAWLRCWNAWDPHFLVDIHSTNGADYQYPITYGLERRGSLDPGLTTWLEGYLAAVEPVMQETGFPLAPYVTFRRWHDPRSGLKDWVASPRFSQGYAAIRNRPGLLVEAHMLKPYPVRVAATRALLDATLAHLAAERDTLRRLADQADRRAASAALRAEPFALDWEATDQHEPFEFLGVAYEEVTSELSGGSYIRYDASQPETFTVEYYNRPRPSALADLPEAYLVPPEWDVVIDRLALHGVQLTRLQEPVTLEVRSWRFQDVTWRERPYEGRHPLRYELEPLREVRTFPVGTAVIDLAQRAAPAAAHGLEPAGPDAFVRWGFFDAIMTRVEYVESYVVEPMMQEMVAANPELLDELEAAKAEDPAFAADPWAIRTWFYARTPYFDPRAYVYPVGLLDDRNLLETLPIK